MRKIGSDMWITSDDNGKYMIVKRLNSTYDVWETSEFHNTDGEFKKPLDSFFTMTTAKRKISFYQRQDKDAQKAADKAYGEVLTRTQKASALSDYFGYSKKEAREILEDMGE